MHNGPHHSPTQGTFEAGFARPRRSTQAAQVYFLRPIGEAGPIKIGWSSDPQARLELYSRLSPTELEIVALVEGGLQMERRFHARFAHLHTHHEWFRSAPELTDTISEIRAGTFDVAGLPESVIPAWHSGFRTTNGPQAGRYNVFREQPQPRGSTLEGLIAEVEDYLAWRAQYRTMAESTFGREAINDSNLLPRLRAGGQITVKRLDMVREFIERDRRAVLRRFQEAA